MGIGRSIFPGLVACAVALAGAEAFEAPTNGPAPYVEICSEQTEGNFNVPGANGCNAVGAAHQATGGGGVGTSTSDDWGAFQFSLAAPESEAAPAPAASNEGWMVQGGLKFNLEPGKSQNVWVQGGYQEGKAVQGNNTFELWNGTVLEPGMANLHDRQDMRQFNAGVGLQASENLNFGLTASYSILEDAGGTDNAELALIGGQMFWAPVEDIDLTLSLLYGEAVSGFAPVDKDFSFSARMERNF